MLSEAEFDAHLRSVASRDLPYAKRVLHFAKGFIGQPYRLGLLGEFPFEMYDPDPLYSLAESDCVTFVENVHAMALARDWESYIEHLLRLRYRDGRIGMLTRNHFTEADWNVNNQWLFEDVTSRIGPAVFRQMQVAIDRAAFFRKYDLGQDLSVEMFQTTYIPREHVPAVAVRLKPADVVEFVRGTLESPYVGHMGLIGDRRQGQVMLIHSAEPRVREEPLLSYMDRSPKIIGIKVLRAREE